MTLLIECSQAKCGRLACQVLAEPVDLRMLQVDCPRFGSVSNLDCSILFICGETLGFAVSSIGQSFVRNNGKHADGSCGGLV